MMHRFSTFLGRFKRNETGHVTVEFAIMVPILLVIMMSAMEVGMLSLRYAFLERAMDVVVREIRLGTGYTPTHDELRARICDEAGFIPDCNNNLKLEMLQISPRNWAGLTTSTTCTDRAEEVQPVTRFHHGGSNDLMLLRACAKTELLFPTSGIGLELPKDASGDVALVALSAFVQEPN